MAGLRPVQIWVPDTRRPGFVQPNAENGLQKPSQVMVDKAMTVKRDRLGPAFGRIDADALVEVECCLAVFLGIAS